MKYFTVICVLLGIAYTNALPYDVIEDNEGQHFYLVPVSRTRRDTNWDVAKGPGGTTVTLGHEGTLAGKGGHELTGGGFVSKTFDPTGPTTVGGSVGYHHIPLDTSLKAVVAQTPNWGTDVSLQASRTLWAPDKNTKLEAYGGASQSFTPWGNTRPEGFGGIRFNHQNNWFSG